MNTAPANLPAAHAMCARCGLHYVPAFGTAGSCPACGGERPWWGNGRPIATPGNYGQRAHAPTPRQAHRTDHTWQAEALLDQLETLAFMYGAGQVDSATTIQRAEQLERQAQDISWAAYAAGRGYAAATRVTGQVFAGAMDLAFTARAAA